MMELPNINGRARRFLPPVWRWLGRLPAGSVLLVLLAVWLAFNLLQGAFTEPADDEAYYSMLGQHLDWGYYDLPPMTALLVWLGNSIGGVFGTRFFFLLMQPLYIFILWRLVWGGRTEGSVQVTEGVMLRTGLPTPKDAALFVMIAASVPMLQLYGLPAAPDVPLMLFFVLFLLCYRRFAARDSWLNTLLLGLSMAAMTYSKYHGALIVGLALLSNTSIFRNGRLYVAATVALTLLMPHLAWEQRNGWPSFKFNLLEHGGPFGTGYLFEYAACLLAAFNPLLWPIYVRAWRKSRSQNQTERALSFVLVGFLVFFLLSGIRGYLRPVWALLATLPLVALLFNYTRAHRRTRKYVMAAGWAMLGLFALLRAEMIFNLSGVRGQIFDNKPTYEAIAVAAGDAPVIFSGNYAVAAKYGLYTGRPAYCQPSLFYRSSQWQLRDDDDKAAVGCVLLEVAPKHASDTLHLANGRDFYYRADSSFHPLRRIAIRLRDPLPDKLQRGLTYGYQMVVANPYDYDVRFAPDSLPVVFLMRDVERRTHEYVQNIRGTVCAGEDGVYMGSFTVPTGLPTGKYLCGFGIRPTHLCYWFNSDHRNIELR
ncbi:MAG: glycosyltransferase family 39 protein [Rikenellaceae bacterium]|jgi:4-amino-4-deoxy-L-arabinose transferase-like glycosyltransferase|nr:glycosyltransferase family 39 protein [Rikenellaceae bacterium]